MSARAELAAILGRANRPSLGSAARAIEDASWLWAADAVLEAGYISPIVFRASLQEAHIKGEKAGIVGMREMADLLLSKYDPTPSPLARDEDRLRESVSDGEA